jgi:sugar phosphate isomerase/epimerase
MRLGAAADLRFTETVSEFFDHLSDIGLNHAEFKREYLYAPPEAPEAERIGELAESYDMSLTYHAPFRDWNLGSFNDASRRAAVQQVKETLDDAATAGAGAVVVHGGSVRAHYPARVREKAYNNAVRSLSECASYAAEVGIPLCLENQPISETKERYTITPDDLHRLLTHIDADPEVLGVTLDVGHATMNGYDWRAFVDQFGNRITVVHLHDNDGTADQHEPLPDYDPIVKTINAEYNLFEMKSVTDIAKNILQSE